MTTSARDQVLAYVREHALAEVVRERLADLLPEVQRRLESALREYEEQSTALLGEVNARVEAKISDLERKRSEAAVELTQVEAKSLAEIARLDSGLQTTSREIGSRQAELRAMVSGVREELARIGETTTALLDVARQRATQAEARVRQMAGHVSELEDELRSVGRSTFTRARRKSDLAFAVAFIPDLPSKLPPSDLETIFAFSRIEARGMPRRPSLEAVALKWEEFQQLSEPEQDRVARLLLSISRKYRLTVDRRIERVTGDSGG